MNKKLEKFIKILIIVSFFVPLVFAPKSFIFPFIVPKVLLFRTIVLLMLGTYGVLLYSQSKTYSLKLNVVVITVFLFLLSFIISTIFGVDIYKSFYDGQERMLGVLTIIHYIVYFLILSIVIKKKEDWLELMKIFLGAGSLVMIIGFFQRFINPNLLLNHNSTRVSATLGNPIYLSAYGLFLFFIGIYLSIKNYVKKQSKQSLLFWYSLLGSILGFLGILLGGTRGTMLGLASGLFVVIVGYLYFGKLEKNVKTKFFSVILISVILLGFAFSYKSSNVVKSIPGVGRILNTSLIEGTGETRLMAWGIAIDAWKEKPLLGWGPNNYYYAFNKYYRPKFLEYGWGETWFDNAHSTIMNTLAVRGVFGVMSYLLLFIIPIYMLYKAYKKQDIDINTFVLFSAFLVGHFVHNALVFENPTSYLYFFFTLAFIASVTSNKKTEIKDETCQEASGFVTWGIGIMIFFLILIINVNPGRANNTFITFLRNFTSGKMGVNYYEGALNFNSPHVDDIRYDFGKNILKFSDNYIKLKKTKEMTTLLIRAYNEMDLNKNMHPMDIRYHLLQADIAQKLARLTQDSSWIIKKEAILQDALRYSPQRQQVIFGLANTKHILRKDDEALVLLQKALDSDKYINYSWMNLINVYNSLGNTNKVAKLKKQAKNYGIDL